jgi:hypothetical protein
MRPSSHLHRLESLCHQEKEKGAHAGAPPQKIFNNFWPENPE